MTQEFIPYQQALELKELGFDEPCFGWFTNSYLRIGSVVENKHVQGEDETLAPLYQQAIRWFRENHDLRIWIESNYGVLKFEYVIATTNPNFIDKQFNDFSGYNTYEEAELACLIKLIEIVKNK
jgi:hypothetical protein